MVILNRAKKKYRFQIGHYCIMDNHIHFILKPLKGENLSAIMQWILGVFAQKYNRTFDLHGHVWYDRFKSKIIIDFRQYLHTFIYISNNPVKAGMVGTPGDYPFSGIYHLQKGIADLIERPPNRVLRVLWSELYCRKKSLEKWGIDLILQPRRGVVCLNEGCSTSFPLSDTQLLTPHPKILKSYES